MTIAGKTFEGGTGDESGQPLVLVRREGHHIADEWSPFSARDEHCRDDRPVIFHKIRPMEKRRVVFEERPDLIDRIFEGLVVVVDCVPVCVEHEPGETLEVISGNRPQL